MLITLPFWYLFEALTEAAKLVTAAIIHGTKNTIQSGIEFNPATTQQYLNALRPGAQTHQLGRNSGTVSRAGKVNEQEVSQAAVTSWNSPIHPHGIDHVTTAESDACAAQRWSVEVLEWATAVVCLDFVLSVRVVDVGVEEVVAADRDRVGLAQLARGGSGQGSDGEEIDPDAADIEVRRSDLGRPVRGEV